jgi:hypothetical protein
LSPYEDVNRIHTSGNWILTRAEESLQSGIDNSFASIGMALFHPEGNGK